jgi:hypothetical protein
MSNKVRGEVSAAALELENGPTGRRQASRGAGRGMRSVGGWRRPSPQSSTTLGSLVRSAVVSALVRSDDSLKRRVEQVTGLPYPHLGARVRSNMS